jgi:uncharacterized protein
MHAPLPEPPGAITDTVIGQVRVLVRQLCAAQPDRLPFHGWHHVRFVHDKAAGFAAANGSDVAVVRTAALVHDLNYVVHRNSAAAAGRDLRLCLLNRAGVTDAAARWIDSVVREAEMAARRRDISLEAQALSDADTLFKALPVTPVMLAHRYLSENGVSLAELAAKIVGEQRHVHDAGYYFYSDEAATTYSRWASANLELWSCVVEALDDPAVTELLSAVG